MCLSSDPSDLGSGGIFSEALLPRVSAGGMGVSRIFSGGGTLFQKNFQIIMKNIPINVKKY